MIILTFSVFCLLLTNLNYLYIINIGNEKHNLWLPLIFVATHLPVKAKVCCFYYSLLVQIMYIIVNKATFIVRDNHHAYIKNNITPINTTSLSHSKNYVVKWQHSHLLLFISYAYTIQYYFFQIK